MNYEIVCSRQAQKDAKKLAKNNLKAQAEEILAILKQDPFRSPPGWEALRGDLTACYSRRINIQHRLVYELLEKKKTVHVFRMWTHYDD